ncbi:MAG TPA: A/G-specific adenine glycosylase [Chthoniobacterales bacterium]|nr:A/G-specific adenine glycosylase [Chthoniobacterales bacterium]
MPIEAKHLSATIGPAASRSEAVAFRAALRRWFRSHQRDLPWRKTTDPYAILVSEFMLQQTQVAAVLPYYSEWTRRFPDFASLAAAPESEVLHAWQGLGYYARARNLHAAAKAVVHQYGGALPRNAHAIRDLPGVGRYTANAIATFAFGDSVPIVEANISRLLARLINLREPIDTGAGQATLWKTAASLLPSRGAAVHNSALMDLGATVCISRRPRCPICPVQEFCQAADPTAIPIKKAIPGLKMLTEAHAFRRRKASVLLEKSEKRWRGMWILPRLADAPGRRPLYRSSFPFTNHRITLTIFACAEDPGPPAARQRWFKLTTLESIPMPSPHRRALRQMLAAEEAQSFAKQRPHPSLIR